MVLRESIPAQITLQAGDYRIHVTYLTGSGQRKVKLVASQIISRQLCDLELLTYLRSWRMRHYSGLRQVLIALLRSSFLIEK
jgi:hypothetical protein